MSSKRPNHSKMSKEGRCRLAESIFIKHPRFKAIIEKIEHAHCYSQIAAEPECLFIGGPPGAGKTTLLNHYRLGFPSADRGEMIEVPVLCGRVPSKATDKNLATTLLMALGDPAAEKGTAFNQTTRLKRFIEQCGVQLIILDEFQHFVDKDSWKVLKSVSDWLKNFIDETGIPVVLIGMPYAVEILDAPGNEQLQRRFAVRATLDSFGWDIDEERKEFRSFLKAADDRLPLNECSNLADPLIAFRFYCATNGRVGKIMKVLRKAVELALDQGLERLTLEVLADAYDERLRADQPDRSNPFRIEKSWLKAVPFDESEMSFATVSRRSRRRARENRASDVLSK
ncbi:MAG TPA: TniB family NTP-binding protein [Pyrinomonadaceae bacterium]|nr:TniB family NTP-binding protein [Pyrinomonadaceae bacterium]